MSGFPCIWAVAAFHTLTWREAGVPCTPAKPVNGCTFPDCADSAPTTDLVVSAARGDKPAVRRPTNALHPMLVPWGCHPCQVVSGRPWSEREAEGQRWNRKKQGRARLTLAGVLWRQRVYIPEANSLVPAAGGQLLAVWAEVGVHNVVGVPGDGAAALADGPNPKDGLTKPPMRGVRRKPQAFAASRSRGRACGW